ncbi:hypothetical protein D9M68_941290 [compost metagenome]
MGAKQGGHHAHRQHFAESTGDAQHLQLVGERQAIAGLDLQRGYPIGQQGLQARHGLGQ